MACRQRLTGDVLEAALGITSDEATAIAEQLFTDEQGFVYGPLKDLSPPEEVIHGSLFRFTASDPTTSRVSVQLFHGLKGLGGDLWEQQARSLLRMSGREHPAIPRVLDGGFHEPSNVAYVLTEAASETLGNRDAMAWFASKPLVAARELVSLADGLARMHGHGIIHRGVIPSAIEVVQEGEEAFHLRLSRFEMSALVRDLLRRVDLDEHADGDLKAIGRDPSELAAWPPERLSQIFPGLWPDSLEDGRSDMFGLGVVAWQWFVGPLPQEPLMAAFGRGVPTKEAIDSFHAVLRRELRSKHLPVDLEEIVLAMLEPDLRSRPTSGQVVDRLTRGYEAIAAQWESVEAEKAHLVTFLPSETGETLSTWTSCPGALESTVGQESLREFLEADLKGARLTYDPSGFRQGRRNEREAKAKWILLGRVGAYYSHLYVKPFGGGELQQALIIKYPIERARARLPQDALCRTVPKIEVVLPGSPALDATSLNHRPNWLTIMRSVEHRGRRRPSWLDDVEEALDLLLQLQHAQALARMYPFVRTTSLDESSRLLAVRLDEVADSNHVYKRHAHVSQFLRNRKQRPWLGDFFAQLEPPNVRFAPDRNGWPNWDSAGDARVERRLDPQSVLLRVAGSATLPDRGWLVPQEDRGLDKALRNQRTARDELLQLTGLIERLRDPRSVVRLRSAAADAGKGLRGQSAVQAVRGILDSWPFFALHGPPGTGKSTVAAHAIEAALRADPGLRILVSSQSHAALDELAEKVIERLREAKLLGGSRAQIQVIRIASERSKEDRKVKKSLEPYFLNAQTKIAVDRIRAHCRDRLASASTPTIQREIQGRFLTILDETTLELHERLRRGANVVFATCAAATPSAVDAVGDFGVYDWVVVEEAAKAWPTEIAIPLVRGIKWTLIGDHRQLPAFRRDEVVSFLDEHMGNAGDTGWQSRRDQYLAVFDMFASIFQKPIDKSARGASRDARGELTRQFRMREPIACVVNAFYDDELETDPSTEVDHGLTAPAAVVGRSLIWLDTSDLPAAQEKPQWSNPCETSVLRGFLKRLRPELTAETAHRLSVLTPYNAQLGALKVSLPTPYSSRVFTVNSYQGGEAEIVVVSAVRFNDYDADDRLRLGHLAQPQLVNVMLSRAKRLMVIVGAIRHYESQAAGFWPEVCRRVRANGIVMSAAPFDDDRSDRLKR